MRSVAIFLLLTALFAVAASACSGGDSPAASVTPTQPAATQPASGATASPGATLAAAATNTPAKATPVTLKPSIEEALSCRVPATAPNRDSAGSGPFQRYTFDLTAFPNATCNDGSPGIAMFRPFVGEENRDRWLIVLEGGGECGNAQECADRWCSVDTNFDSQNMSSDFDGQSRPGGGILLREPGSPFGNWNQVVVKFCTSDSWAGQALDIQFTALDPKSGKEVTYDISFAGSYMFQSTISLLRREQGTPLVFTRSNTPMPDLDQAKEIVFAGGSAGGAGVISNLDRLADMMKDAPNKPVIRGFIDAVVGPNEQNLGYSQTILCRDHGLCTHDDQFRGVAASQVLAGQKRWTDDSCIAWHQKNQPGTEAECFDQNHVLENHVTTPYFVRMALRDSQRFEGVTEVGYTDLQGNPFNSLTFGVALRNTLLGLQDAVKSGHESSAVSKLPGVFAPSCRIHYSLLDTELVLGTTVVGTDGKTYRLFDVWNAWVANGKPDSVITSNPATDVCPGE